MLNFWKRCTQPKNTTNAPICYVGISAVGYGADFDIIELCQGNHDELFQKNNVAFGRCEIFNTLENAIKVMKRRGVTDDSSFILVVTCPADELRERVKKQNFSELILGYINVRSENFDFIEKPESRSEQKGMQYT